jgi:hypothetical protein
MNECSKTPSELINEMLLNDHPAERLKKLEEEGPSLDGQIKREINLAPRIEQKQ